MPVFNSEKYLEDAIDSILSQTFSDFEFLIFDDGSSDSSPEIIRHYSALDSRIIPHYYQKNVGYVVHLNNGIRWSKGRYIARMDSDDLSLPDRLAVQVAFLEKNPSVGVVGASSIRIDEEGKELGTDIRKSSSSYLYWQCYFLNPFAHSTVMYRRVIFDAFEGYDVDKMPAEDYHLWTKLVGRWNLANVEKPLTKYREHNYSVSNINRDVQFRKSGESLIELWRNELNTVISYDEMLFLKKFHKGYDQLPAQLAHPLFNKILKLERQRRIKFGNTDSGVERDLFGRCLYLVTKERSHSLIRAVQMMMYLFFRYPLVSLRYFAHGRV